MTRSVLVLALAMCLVSGVARAEPTLHRSATHVLREMAPGVYFARAAGTGAVNLVCNTMVVVNDDHVVVVDSHITPDAGRALADSVAAVTDKPIRYLVNTHFHFDHAHGNAGFPETTTVLAHEATWERLAQDATQEPIFRVLGTAESAAFQVAEAEEAVAKAGPAERPAAEQRLAMWKRHEAAVRALVIRPPDLAFDRELTLREGGRTIELLFLGRGHTAGDVVVWLPAERILFTGDLLQPGAPYLGDGYPDEWGATLDAIAALPFGWVLPGHGEPFNDRSVIETQKRFVREFATEARALRAQGHDAAAAAERMRLAGWGDYVAPALRMPPILEIQIQRVFDLDDGRVR